MKTTQNIFLALVLTIFSCILHATPQTQKEWTMLVFINGHNNLSPFATMNLKDMEKTGSSDQVNIVVEWGSEESNLTKRMLVKKSTDPKKVTSPVLLSFEDHDMGDYNNLVDFVKWGSENFPARHYFVAVWNHGSGWHFQNRNAGSISTNDISFDDHTGNKITTEQLGVAMGQIKQIIGRNIDIYGSDACLMAMVEVAAEMKDSVDYFVGSEDTEPEQGWPYAPFLQKWLTKPTMTPAEVSILLSKEYKKAYSGGVYGAKEVTFSAMDLSKLDALLASTKALAASFKNYSKDALKEMGQLMNSVSAFYYSDYKDFGNFLTVMSTAKGVTDKKLFNNVAADIKNVVISVESTQTFQFATGISIWFPDYESKDEMTRYTGLEFDKQTSWSGVIDSILANK
ncbi:MAG: hypothetical protein H7328_04770 [Bdellovibrio sp.]|nr:hypothetical protein [Bdellovibrio sp.]